MPAAPLENEAIIRGARPIELLSGREREDEMEKEAALAILRAHRAELQRLGVKSLALFGSVARNEAAPGSDVDILVDLGVSPTFDQYMNVLEFLEERLEANVDLVTVGGLRARVRPHVKREMIRVA